MTMSKDTLKTGLLAIGNQSTEAGAIAAWVDAYTTYAAEAGATPIEEEAEVPILEAAVTAAGVVMAGNLVGMASHVTSAALTLLPAAITQFWTTLATTPVATFTGATAMAAPPHATLAEDFSSLMTENIASTDADASLEALADLLHDAATTGGTVSFPLFSAVPIK